MNQRDFIHSQPPSSARELEETYWWYRARRKIICDIVQRFLIAPGELIDFGGGSGVIARRLADLGYQVRVADLCADALASCRRLGLETVDLNLTWPAEHCADAILAADVLEHIGDDIGTLRKLHSVLRPQGWLFVTVPAYNFLWSGEDYVSNHVRRYTRGLLEKNVRTANFTIEWCSYFNMLLLPLITGYLSYKRLARPQDMYVSDIQPLPEWQNNVLYHIFAAERNMLPRIRFPAGASIFLVARASAS